MKYLKYLLIVIIPIMFLTLGAKILAQKNHKALHYLSNIYFDKRYYLVTYPEVISQDIEAFDHYISKEWLEGKILIKI